MNQSRNREEARGDNFQIVGGGTTRRRGTFPAEKRKPKTTKNKMNEESQVIGNLADDARTLVDLTANVAGEKVAEARERLAAALERGKEIYGRVREKAVEGAAATDKAVHEHPYQSIGIAVGAGAVLGYLLACRCSSNHE